MTDIITRLRSQLESLDPAIHAGWRDTLALRQRVQDEFREAGHLSLATFEAVLDWKLRKQRNRTEKRRRGNSAVLIRQITSCFALIEHKDDITECEIKLNVLRALPGVGLGVASAILTLAHPENYGIIDFRVWKVLYGEDKKVFAISDYRKYRDDVRKIAEELGCDAQVVDFLLLEEYEKCPEGVSGVYLKMRMTAERYLDLGPEEYRNTIDPELQLEGIPVDMLDSIGHGMRQILEGCGLTQDNPFTGLDIDGFYAVAELLNLETELQALAEFRGRTEMLDAMHMVDSVTGARVVLFNLVPTPSARSAAEAEGGRKIRIGPERLSLRKSS